jgi:ubiquinone/menaquinone biosynthesis C-methylase UbiE
MPLAHHRSPASMRAFYDRIYRIYPMIERSIDPILAEVEERWISTIPDAVRQTALEYACGSGSLSLVLGRRFGSVEGRDASERMIERARTRAAAAGLTISFRTGDLLAVDEPPDSFDHVFVSFALHLFSPEQVPDILRRLLAVARESVVIVDHPRRWSLGTAFMEWLEGSWYAPFIRTDFGETARRIGARSFQEQDTGRALVLRFSRRA